MQKELEFLKITENLKKELRHSWLSNCRQESVAEHSWRLSLMVMRYADKLEQPVDVTKCLKYAVIHDLPEAIVGDIPVFQCHTPELRAAKLEREHAAMIKFKKLLGDAQGDELYHLWLEYEAQENYESRYVRALDKLEAFIQHNEAPIETWGENEKKMIFQPKWLEQHCAFDSFILDFAKHVLTVSAQKLKEAGYNIAELRQQAMEEV